MNFGVTRCGEILDEKIRHDKKLSRKMRNFYSQSCAIINGIKTITNPSVRKVALLAYINYRQRQVDGDLKLTVYDKEFVMEITKRLKYVIRHHANKS